MLTWWNRPASTSLKSLPCPFHCSHSRQHIRLWCIPLWRQTRCLWATRHSTGCLWEGQGQRQQREPEQRSFIWGDKDKTPFLWREKSKIFKECKQVNFVGDSGKLLKGARFSLPCNISKFFVARLRLMDGFALWCLIPLWREREPDHTCRHVIQSRTTKPSLHAAQQWVLTRM